MTFKWILAVVLVGASSSPLAGQAVYLTTVPTVTGGCYFCYRDPVADFGAYEGYVSGTIDGVPFSNWISDEFVWDGSYQPNIAIPSGPISYTLTSFSGPGTDLSNTWPDFAYPSIQPYNTVLAKYEVAALLLGGDGTPGLPGFANIDKSNAALVQAYQFALYSIFTDTSTIAYWGFDPTVGGAATALLNQAQSDIANPLPRYSVTFSQLRVYTPISESLCHQDFLNWCGTNSEFLALAPNTSSPVGVSPPSGSGSSQVLAFTFSDQRGWQDLDVINILINNSLDGRNACYLAYSRSAGVLYLVPDSGGGLLPALTLGGSGSTSNSQCSVASGGSSADGSGNTLTVTLNITFTASFGRNTIVYMAAGDMEHNNSGWQPLGVWNVPGAAQTTTTAVVGMTPASGSGSITPTAFAFTFSDTKSTQDFGIQNILINSALDGRQACYLAYARPINVLYLVSDPGTALLPGQSVAAAGTLSNSQCTVSWGAMPVATSANNLTLTLNIAFSAGFGGNRVFYLASRDLTDANNSGWQAMGTWSVR